MKSVRHLRVSFLAVFALCLVVALSACSKKDVVSDEPGFNPSEGGGAAMGEGGVGSTAGDATAPAEELSTVYYAYDSFSLSSEGRDALKTNAQWMKDNPNSTVQIEGHCDDRGTTEYNLALGERRANAARDYLVKLGIDSSRVSVISYGEERPAVTGSDESAWAKNRRSSFVILSR